MHGHDGQQRQALSDWIFNRGGRSKLIDWLALDARFDSGLYGLWTGFKSAWNAASNFFALFRLTGFARAANEVTSELATLGTGGIAVMLLLAQPAFVGVHHFGHAPHLDRALAIGADFNCRAQSLMVRSDFLQQRNQRRARRHDIALLAARGKLIEDGAAALALANHEVEVVRARIVGRYRAGHFLGRQVNGGERSAQFVRGRRRKP